MKHLQKLTTWAGGDGGIAPLGALFGYHLTANAESSGIPIDQSCFQCQRNHLKMGKIKKKNCSNFRPKICEGATLRDENSRKKDHDVCSVLKMKHLQKLATWAGGDGGIAPLGALFGYHLAANAESSGIPIDQSCFQCQRCESILQPGFNCTIRIQKNKPKRKRGKKASVTSFQNSVVYKCNFCSHHNMIKGTQKDHLKSIISSQDSGHVQLSRGPAKDSTAKTLSTNGANSVSQSNHANGVTSNCEPRTPMGLQSNKRKKEETISRKIQLSGNSGQLTDSGKQPNRKKRKGWSSLRDIVERKEAESCKNFDSFVIPFPM
ncbi:hypothetical protein HPP92_021782 [Vanilla planifolia]|uniref:Uncharacterized protein n=1 Tax=Vanilla planifolia TaxID=51239 RepID=A0A835UHY3_VANPL|nr:hypothetical protein HPP92_021782 [Vanilla planifolia]